MPLTVIDPLGTRLTLLQQNEGAKLNWLCIPGGPGADARYYQTLTDIVQLPGNVWTVDFMENGSNLKGTAFDENFDFEVWGKALLSLVENLENVVLVGHSFGGMFPLLFPQLENQLKGFVIISSAPKIWLEKAVEKALTRNLPSFDEPMIAFETHKTPETFANALEACVPYYFPPSSIMRGRTLLVNLPFNYHAASWWLNKAGVIGDFAKWVPQKMPLMIIGGSEDCVTPIEMYLDDQRFHRDNIEIHEIKDAGHFPWIEKPKIVVDLFSDFVKKVDQS